LAPPLSLASSYLSCPLALHTLPPPPALHVFMAGLFSTLSLSLPFSDSTTLLTPLPMPWINSILYYTVVWLVPEGEGMPWHGPSETPSSPTPPHTPIEHILLALYRFTITTITH
jgi:hypothetical protein